ncbi:MAG: hypothetical protein MHMPM18_002895 [Marteilia pararefringens]
MYGFDDDERIDDTTGQSSRKCGFFRCCVCCECQCLVNRPNLIECCEITPNFYVSLITIFYGLAKLNPESREALYASLVVSAIITIVAILNVIIQCRFYNEMNPGQ